MKRVGVMGFIHESNTFSVTPTTYEHFEQISLTRGKELIERWTGGKHELSGFLEGAESNGLEPVPLVAAFAMPSGAVVRETFEAIAEQTIDALKAAMPVDGLYLGLHGATVSEEFPDADGEMARRMREVVGPDVPVVMTLDLHANVSPKMVANADATTIYRSNPHLDQKARGLEAASLLGRTLRGEIRPVQALECPPLIISIAKQYTDEDPAKGLYEDVESVLKWPGILSASVAMGFYYADVEEMGATFLAVADHDRDLARKAARWMAQRAWDRREEFRAELPSAAEAVAMAMEAAEAPVVLLDIGDNVGGGSPGDSTLILAEIVAQKASNAMVVLFDAESVARCVEAGVRNQVNLQVGGKTDGRHGSPVSVQGRVRMISDGIFQEPEVRHGGWGSFDQGVTAVVETPEQHTLILTSVKMAPVSLEQVKSLGVKPESKKILVAKGVIAPRAAYNPVAARTILVDTPGATCVNPAGFTFHHRRRPIYPLELEAQYPLA
jgi:microcystin degradation protein MlrC